MKLYTTLLCLVLIGIVVTGEANTDLEATAAEEETGDMTTLQWIITLVIFALVAAALAYVFNRSRGEVTNGSEGVSRYGS